MRMKVIYKVNVANELCTCMKSNLKTDETCLMRYPDDIGITGKIFKNDGYYISFKGRKEMNFHEIDNVGNYAEIKNFLFLPTYGFNGQRNGIIQLFNKKKGNPDEHDIQHLKPYQKLIGMLMHNVIESNRIIDIDMNIRRILLQLGDKTQKYNKEHSRYSSAIDNLEFVVENLQKILKENEMAKSDIVRKNPIHFGINY